MDSVFCFSRKTENNSGMNDQHCSVDVFVQEDNDHIHYIRNIFDENFCNDGAMQEMARGSSKSTIIDLFGSIHFW